MIPILISKSNSEIRIVRIIVLACAIFENYGSYILRIDFVSKRPTIHIVSRRSWLFPVNQENKTINKEISLSGCFLEHSGLKRELPFLSPVSIAFTVLVFVILGFSLWFSGGLGFSPGAVTAQSRAGVTLQGYSSHAEFEEQCAFCHQPLNRSQSELCVECHQNISDQLDSKTGTHGKMDSATVCKDCHSEHKGRDFDPVAFAVAQYDHTQTRLALTGAHSTVDCEDCHTGGNYQLEYQDCKDCHVEPAMHTGMFTQNCDTCHTDLDWRPAFIEGELYDHEQSRFSLARHPIFAAPQELVCVNCHSAQTTQADLQTCDTCHTDLDPGFMQEHLKTMGEDCLQCHDGKDRMSGFDHASVFLLDGKHSRLECSACHTDFRFGGTPSACTDCHAEPDIHAGFFGDQCQHCHTTQGWTPAMLVQHTFPLDHGKGGEVSCLTCHPDAYPQYTCYSCHEHQPEEMAKEHLEEGIPLEELATCAKCHPTGLEDEAEDDVD
jgi:hypothetical protein